MNIYKVKLTYLDDSTVVFEQDARVLVEVFKKVIEAPYYLYNVVHKPLTTIHVELLKAV